jgi:hypothetical protein
MQYTAVSTLRYNKAAARKDVFSVVSAEAV